MQTKGLRGRVTAGHVLAGDEVGRGILVFWEEMCGRACGWCRASGVGRLRWELGRDVRWCMGRGCRESELCDTGRESGLFLGGDAVEGMFCGGTSGLSVRWMARKPGLSGR